MSLSIANSRTTSFDRKGVSNAFKALSDQTRLRMLRLLVSTSSELCVCEFVDTLQERLYNISKHLKILEQAGLIEGTKEGRWVYYRIVEAKDAVGKALHELVNSVPDLDEMFATDRERFTKRMELRENGRCQVGVQTRHLAE